MSKNNLKFHKVCYIVIYKIKKKTLYNFLFDFFGFKYLQKVKNIIFLKITIKGTIGKDFGFSLSDRNRGIYVHTVKQDSPACNAGLLPNDRILQVRYTLLYEKI